MIVTGDSPMTYYTDEGILFRRVGYATPEVWQPRAARWRLYDRNPLLLGSSLSEAEARERFPAAFAEWAAPNDVAAFGEKDISGAYAGPLNIPGLGSVAVSELPPLTDQDRDAQQRARRSNE